MKRRFLPQLPSRRSLGALATVAALTALTSGCSVMSPIQTTFPYAPADGVQTTIGDLAIRDLVLVGSGTGPVVVSGAAINLGDKDLTVQFTSEQGGTSGSEVQLKPRQQVALATQGLELTGITAKPGSIASVLIHSSAGGDAVIGVPVLGATDYYATITPAPTSS